MVSAAERVSQRQRAMAGRVPHSARLMASPRQRGSNLENIAVALYPRIPSRILIVDGMPVFRLGLIQILTQTADLHVCADTADLQQGLQMAHALQPDLVLVDTVRHGGSLLDMLTTFRQHLPTLRLLVLTTHDERFYALRALRAGARGYLPKHTEAPHLLDAIRLVLRGGIAISDATAARLHDRSGVAGWESARTDRLAALSNRELEVLDYLGRGYSNRQIAKQWSISVRTVETHRAHLMQKLRLARASELLLYAAYWRWDRGGASPVKA